MKRVNELSEGCVTFFSELRGHSYYLVVPVVHSRRNVAGGNQNSCLHQELAHLAVERNRSGFALLEIPHHALEPRSQPEWQQKSAHRIGHPNHRPLQRKSIEIRLPGCELLR